jgi:uncharacterized protein
MPELPRFVPDWAFPPYTFIPGRRPHPVSDPRGHQYGQAPEPAAPLDPEHWQASRDYLRGLDLFNHGYFWEAHEAWEGLWHACGRTGTTAAFLKGLIKLAAAGVKHLEEVPNGVRSHGSRAAELFAAVARERGADEHFLGLSVKGLLALATTVGEQDWPAEPPMLLPVVPQE